MKIVNQLTEDQLAYWLNGKLVMMTAPSGHENDVEACASIHTLDQIGEHLVRVVHVAWKLDEVELMHLAQGGTIWLSTVGGLPPHFLEVQPPVAPDSL